MLYIYIYVHLIVLFDCSGLLASVRIGRAAKVLGVRCWRSGGQKLEIGGQMLEVEYKVLDLN